MFCFFSLFSCAVSYYLSGYATKFGEIKKIDIEREREVGRELLGS